jgi:hypothetical protein
LRCKQILAEGCELQRSAFKKLEVSKSRLKPHKSARFTLAIHAAPTGLWVALPRMRVKSLAQ